MENEYHEKLKNIGVDSTEDADKKAREREQIINKIQSLETSVTGHLGDTDYHELEQEVNQKENQQLLEGTSLEKKFSKYFRGNE